MTREELIQMLQILIDQAAPGIKETTTVIYDVKADSFEWVIKGAIDYLERNEDEQPVKRGKWSEIYHDIENYSAECTNCGKPTVRRAWVRPYEFCPHCGARMEDMNNV